MIINSKKKTKIYVDSLLMLVKANTSSLSNYFKIGNELFFLNTFICSSEKIKYYFLENNLKDKIKYKILLELFPGLSFLTKNFLTILSQRRHLYLLSNINHVFQEKLRKLQQIITIKIIIFCSLSNNDNDLENLYKLIFNTLKIFFNSSNFFLSISYDPKILGGIIFQQENLLLDLSIKNTLKKLIKI